jgi:NB-ARC domain
MSRHVFAMSLIYGLPWWPWLNPRGSIMNTLDQVGLNRVGSILQEAIKQYAALRGYRSLVQARSDISKYIENNTSKVEFSLEKNGYGLKTIYRDMKYGKISDWRIAIYAKWLHKIMNWEITRVAEFLEYTTYPHPDDLLRQITSEFDIQSVKTNVLPLILPQGEFLPRDNEINELREWAEQKRCVIAMLCGFGGNGKTTIQQKVGIDFVRGSNYSMRWKYDGAVWVSARENRRLSLLDILGKIAEIFRVLESDNSSMVNPEVLKREVKAFLEGMEDKVNRILVLIDNFETVPEADQREILEFFTRLSGMSQVLISSRYHSDKLLWPIYQDRRVECRPIRVEGLLPEYTLTVCLSFDPCCIT